MMKIFVSCIGSGNMGTALMKQAAAVVGAENVGLSDIDKSKAKATAKVLGAKLFTSNIDAVEESNYVFLSLKPQIFKNVLEEIAPVVQKRFAGQKIPGGKPLTLVSIAPGWSTEKIQSVLGVRIPVVRTMPNTPALISRGVIAIAPSPEVSAKRLAELEKILSGAGLVDQVEERFMDAVTGLSGSGPAFAYIFIEALADGGVRAGLQRDKALRYAAQTVLGAASMVLETGKHPAELKDMVASPGGTTIAGIAALENSTFRAAAINAVEAAWRRSEELG